jgi:hypothetical protein
MVKDHASAKVSNFKPPFLNFTVTPKARIVPIGMKKVFFISKFKICGARNGRLPSQALRPPPL